MAELDTVASSDIIFKSFYIYAESMLEQCSSARLDEFRDLVKQWEGWDMLTTLTNYRSVLGTMFSFLKDMDSLRNGHAIAKEISERLHQTGDFACDQLAFILSDSESYKALVARRGDSARQLLDIIQELLDLFPHSRSRPLLCQALLRLSRASELHPTCFPLHGLQRTGKQAAAGGAFGDIWKGLVCDQTVAVKMMRVFGDSDMKAVLKEFGREALIWRQLSHLNLLPFYGLFYVEERLCLVSPWMENGHILQFLKNAPPDTNRLSLILDVALGLEYLHEKCVVHGDLKGMNVLVTPSGRACITDFGLSSIANAMTLRFTHSTATAQGGTARYQAPELLLGEQVNHFGSDVYAFACLCYEITTGKVPFWELPNDIAVSLKVIAGHRPSRPESASENLWVLLQDCWAQSFEERPKITQVVERLVGPQIGVQSAPAATDWDETFSSKFRRSLQDSPLLPSITGIERQLFGDDVAEACQECSPKRRKARALPARHADLAVHRKDVEYPSMLDVEYDMPGPPSPQDSAVYSFADSPLSPNWATFNLSENNDLAPTGTQLHARVVSDTASERKHPQSAFDKRSEDGGRPTARNLPQQDIGMEADTREQRPGRAPQHQSDVEDNSPGPSNSWVMVNNSPRDDSDYSVTPLEAERHSPSSPAWANARQLSPRSRYKGSIRPPYTGQPLPIPPAPRVSPPSIPTTSPKARIASGSRRAGPSVPAKRMPPTSSSTWVRLTKGTKTHDTTRPPGSHSSNLVSAGDDPYRPPQSALGNTIASSNQPYRGQFQTSDFGLSLEGDYRRSLTALSPNHPFPTSASTASPSRSTRLRDIHRSNQQSPVGPRSPRFRPRQPGSSSSPLVTNGVPPPSEIITTGTNDASLSEDARWAAQLFESESSPIMPITLHMPSSSDSGTVIRTVSSDSESNNDTETWPKPPTIHKRPTSTLRGRGPPLTVQIEGTNGNPWPLSQHLMFASGSTPLSQRPCSPSPDSLAITKPKASKGARGSTFSAREGDAWAPRPPPEDVYERLEVFFPEHDLDKPVIEASSTGTSPTSPDQTLVSAPIPSKAWVRRKKSIRLVAQEGRIAATQRKRSTKPWGRRVEEIDTSNVSQSPSTSEGPTTFKWVRGELIGRGTYGRVYLALNATTGEMIAVKQVEIPRTVSDKNDSRQVTVVQALKLESETLKVLDHPNIVKYLGFEETPANLSIFLEYVPGGSIASCLLTHGKFDEEVTKSFTSQILAGLEYLHSMGILHRDLKSDNILVEMSGVCKISDFGISKRTDDHNDAHTAMQGTVFWMAPEVINTQKKGYNFKIDIWSIGCVVLEMWAGTRPWLGDELFAVMFKLFQAKLPPPVPDGLVLTPLADDFRKKCFAINPEERPPAAELRRHPYLIPSPGWVFDGFAAK